MFFSSKRRDTGQKLIKKFYRNTLTDPKASESKITREKYEH